MSSSAASRSGWQEVFTAMIALKEGYGSFADALIVALGARAGCSRTLTFDHKALRLPGFAAPWLVQFIGVRHGHLSKLVSLRG